MTTKKRIEVFSAGCSTCKETIELVKRIAGASHEVVIHGMHQSRSPPKRRITASAAFLLSSLTVNSQDAARGAGRMSMSCPPHWLRRGIRRSSLLFYPRAREAGASLTVCCYEIQP
jgi:hypothetical protein